MVNLNIKKNPKLAWIQVWFSVQVKQDYTIKKKHCCCKGSPNIFNIYLIYILIAHNPEDLDFHVETTTFFLQGFSSYIYGVL